MNQLDKQYADLLQTILEYGVEKKDRTGTGTKSIFGYTIRHNMKDGFPLLTTKKMPFRLIATELIWFLRGDTNIKYLVDNDCHIWDGDAYKAYEKKALDVIGENEKDKLLSKEEFINKIKTDDEFAKKWGELGPVYGKQWRSWCGFQQVPSGWRHGAVTHFKELPKCDQIAKLIHDLKTNPDSRRLMVSSWNVGELDQMTLPPCHYGFQVYTRELSSQERKNIYDKSPYIKDILPTDENGWNSLFDDCNIPTRAISLMWNQRSVDTFLGLPFNISSYGLLLEIIAKEVNMVPDELIGNLGDTHLYSNHIEQAKEQIGRELDKIERINYGVDILGYESLLDYGHSQNEDELIIKLCDEWGVPKRTREPYPLPTLKIENVVKWVEGDCLPSYSISDFTIENYQSHPTIKAPLSN
jgi:thymidylate synthase